MLPEVDTSVDVDADADEDPTPSAALLPPPPAPAAPDVEGYQSVSSVPRGGGGRAERDSTLPTSVRDEDASEDVENVSVPVEDVEEVPNEDDDPGTEVELGPPPVSPYTRLRSPEVSAMESGTGKVTEVEDEGEAPVGGGSWRWA